MDVKKFQPQNGVWLPKHYGWKAWSFDPGVAANSYTPTSTNSFSIRLKIDEPTPLNNILIGVTGSGSGLSGAYGAIYQNDILLGQTADRKADFTSIGGKTMPLVSSVNVTEGFIDATIWFIGTTPPNVARSSALSFVGDFLTGVNKRFSLTDTIVGGTAPGTLGTKTSLGNSVWLAVS